MQFEQTREESPGRRSLEGSALHKRHRVSEVGKRQSPGQSRSVGNLGRVAGGDEFRGRPSNEAAAASEVVARTYWGVVGSSETSVSTGPTPDTSSRRRTASDGL